MYRADEICQVGRDKRAHVRIPGLMQAPSAGGYTISIWKAHVYRYLAGIAVNTVTGRYSRLSRSAGVTLVARVAAAYAAAFARRKIRMDPAAGDHTSVGGNRKR